MDAIVLTGDDVADLNRMAVERSAALARIGGSVLVGIGLLGALLWLWLTYRTQDGARAVVNITFGVDDDSRSASLSDRIDLLSTSFGLLLSSSLVAGLGLVARMAGDFAQARVGGSVTGYREGDTLDEGEEADAEA